MRQSLTTAETVRLRSDSGCTAHERMKPITEIEKSGQSSRRWFYLIAGGRDRLQPRAEITRVSVRQLPDGHWRQSRPLGWSFTGRRQAFVTSCDLCPRHGGGMECDPLVGLMLAGQQSQPHPLSK